MTKYRVMKRPGSGNFYPQWRTTWTFWQYFDKDKGWYTSRIYGDTEQEAIDYIEDHCKTRAEEELLKQRFIKEAKAYKPREISCKNL